MLGHKPLRVTQLPFSKGKGKRHDGGESRSPAFQSGALSPPQPFLCSPERCERQVHKHTHTHTHTARKKRKPRRPPSGDRAGPPAPRPQPSPCQRRLLVTTVIGRLNSWRGAGLLALSRQGGRGLSKTGLSCYLPHQPQQHLATFFKHPARA